MRAEELSRVFHGVTAGVGFLARDMTAIASAGLAFPILTTLPSPREQAV